MGMKSEANGGGSGVCVADLAGPPSFELPASMQSSLSAPDPGVIDLHFATQRLAASVHHHAGTCGASSTPFHSSLAPTAAVTEVPVRRLRHFYPLLFLLGTGAVLVAAEIRPRLTGLRRVDGNDLIGISRLRRQALCPNNTYREGNRDHHKSGDHECHFAACAFSSILEFRTRNEWQEPTPLRSFLLFEARSIVFRMVTVTLALILDRYLLCMVHDEHFDRSPARFQLQTELLL
jgi:hypothetical protein